MKVKYILDKETKGSYRFTPEDSELIGPATIYLQKPVVKQLGIDPEKGFVMSIEPIK